MARSQLPRTEADWLALLASDKKGIVRSAKDRNALLKSKKNPLAGLPKKAVEAFTKNLVFKNNGLAHADYSPIVDRLTYSEFKKVWEAFGLSMSLFADHDGYKCAGTGDCESMNDHICTSNCRTSVPDDPSVRPGFSSPSDDPSRLPPSS
jgi:hypothetical protein